MAGNNTWQGRAYAGILFLIALTGFAQMPIFKRYYIADFPGLGWLAKFYVTHWLHYLLATIFLGFCAYVLLDFLLERRGGSQGRSQGAAQELSSITASGYVRIVSILGLVFTGGILVVKNLGGVFLPHGLIILTDILHIVFCMVLLGTGAYARIRQKRWTR